MSFKSFAEAGERLCGPDIGHHHGAKTEKSCNFVVHLCLIFLNCELKLIMKYLHSVLKCSLCSSVVDPDFGSGFGES